MVSRATHSTGKSGELVAGAGNLADGVGHNGTARLQSWQVVSINCHEVNQLTEKIRSTVTER